MIGDSVYLPNDLKEGDFLLFVATYTDLEIEDRQGITRFSCSLADAKVLYDLLSLRFKEPQD